MTRTLAALAAALTLAGGLAACEPPPTSAGACQYPRSSTAVQTVSDASVTGNGLATSALLTGVASWNALGHRGPTFTGSAAAHRVNVTAWSDPWNQVLGSWSGACAAGGYSTSSIRFNVGRLFVLADPYGSAHWVGSHELGHALGLAHSTPEGRANPPSGSTDCSIGTGGGTVMFWSDEIFWRCGINAPTSGDRAAVDKLYD